MRKPAQKLETEIMLFLNKYKFPFILVFVSCNLNTVNDCNEENIPNKFAAEDNIVTSESRTL